MTKPLFSIIIPVYNTTLFLKQCIDSILNQDAHNYELIIVNDGSTDNSKEIIIEYATISKQIKFLDQENKGVAAARNNGLLNAVGDYILFVDSDDYWLSNRVLKDLEALILKDPVDLILHVPTPVFFNHKPRSTSIPSYDKIKTKYFKEEVNQLILEELYAASPWDKVIKKTILMDNDILFPIHLKSEDMVWSARLIPIIKTFNVFPYSFYGYRKMREGSATSYVSEKHVLDIMSQVVEGVANAHKNNDFKISLENFWSKSYIDVVKYSCSVDNGNKKRLKDFLYKYKYLLTKGRNKQLDKVIKMQKIIPFKYLPVAFSLFNKVNPKIKYLKSLLSLCFVMAVNS